LILLSQSLATSILILPCISVDIGGKEIEISPDIFNLGPVSDNPERCFAGAAWIEELTGRRLASDSDPYVEQNSGFSVTSSCRTPVLTVPGMWVTAASASRTW
jgi:hypothetical protein